MRGPGGHKTDYTTPMRNNTWFVDFRPRVVVDSVSSCVKALNINMGRLKIDLFQYLSEEDFLVLKAVSLIVFLSPYFYILKFSTALST